MGRRGKGGEGRETGERGGYGLRPGRRAAVLYGPFSVQRIVRRMPQKAGAGFAEPCERRLFESVEDREHAARCTRTPAACTCALHCSRVTSCTASGGWWVSGIGCVLFVCMSVCMYVCRSERMHWCLYLWVRCLACLGHSAYHDQI